MDFRKPSLKNILYIQGNLCHWQSRVGRNSALPFKHPFIDFVHIRSISCLFISYKVIHTCYNTACLVSNKVSLNLSPVLSLNNVARVLDYSSCQGHNRPFRRLLQQIDQFGWNWSVRSWQGKPVHSPRGRCGTQYSIHNIHVCLKRNRVFNFNRSLPMAQSK